MSREEQFDFYWKEIFDGLAYNPIEFNVYRFDQSMSLPGKVNKLYDMFKVLALNNQEVMDYLKEFVETFDFKLETTVKDILIVWLNEGLLADVVRESINEEVIEARTDYLDHTYLDLKERLDLERQEVIDSRGGATTLVERLDSDKAEVSAQLSQRPTQEQVDLQIDTSEQVLNEKIEMKTYFLEKVKRSPYPYFFGFTGITDIPQGGAGSFDSGIAGEPFVTKDIENNCYRMFYFGQNDTGQVFVLSATSTKLHAGTWVKSNINLSDVGATNAHKFTLLVDVVGNPIKINGKYHAYVVGYPTKEIRHWETDNLANKWVETGVVIPIGFSGNGSDGRAADAPCAIWDAENKKVLLFYMAQPSTPQADFGFAHRINRAVSNNPDVGFTYDGIACLPSTDSTDWFYGWLGGSQVRLAPDKTLWIALNAGKTRPSGAGGEPNSLWGMAKADNLYSQWVVGKTPKSYLPFVGEISPSLVIPNAVESINIWRPFLIYDEVFDKWLCYYNTGVEGNEKITHSFEGYLYYYYNTPNGSLTLTTAEQKIPCTTVKLEKGRYNVTLEANIMGGSTTLTKVDIEVRCYVNNFPMTKKSRFFLGNYNYENTNGIINIPLVIYEDNREVEFRAIVTGGTPSADTKIRDFSVTVQQF